MERDIQIRVAVCDDEAVSRNQISRLVLELFPQAQIGLFEDAQKLLRQAGEPDIIFLDIRMAGLDGMTAAKMLRENGCSAVLIFVTALEEYVFEAFDVDAFHYLVKPVDPVQLFKVLRRAVKVRQARPEKELRPGGAQPDMICIKSGGVTRKILLDEILYIEVFNRKCVLHKVNGTVEFYGRLSALEKHLGENFFRPHRSYLVHLKYISKYNAAGITLEDGTVILLAKQRYAAFVNRYMQYAGNLKTGKDNIK